ncbi:DUF7739 domain-containing protein [Streptomyces sp. NPDC001571]
MTTTIPVAASHLVTSHGADFFGEDRYTLKSLTSLAAYAEGALPYDERGPLVQLLKTPAEMDISAEQARLLAALLLRVSRHRFTKPQPSKLARALADAASRAAADGQPWEWRIQPGA